MIPTIIGETLNQKTTLACFNRKQFSHESPKIGSSLEISNIDDDPKYILGSKPSLKVLSFVWKNSKNINILQVFHFTKESAAASLLFRLRNPKGFLYVKMDAGDHWIDQWTREKTLTFSFSRLWIEIFGFVFCNFTNLVTIESQQCHKAITKLFPGIESKLKILPNGVDSSWLQINGFQRIEFQEKEQLIITVGRIGSHQKNTEMILEALTKINCMNGWKIGLIGPVTPEFKLYLDKYFETKPHIQKNVVLVGEITDKKELYRWYSRAKFFLLTSRWEGFSLAMIDALYFGCHIISTPTSAAADATNNWKLGTQILSSKDLSSKLQKIFNNEEVYTEEEFRNIQDFSKRFYWTTLVQNLMNWMKII